MFILLFAVVIILNSDSYITGGQKDADKSDYVELPPLKAENTHCISFSTLPLTLDPAISYSSNEAAIMGVIYESPLTYHPLKRPYQLIPQVAETMPKFTYRWKETGKDLSKTEVKRLLNEIEPAFSEEELNKIEIFLDIKIKKGIYYAPHPCFAKDEEGNYKYYNLTESEVEYFNHDLFTLKTTNKDTRELVSKDFVYQIKRLFNPAAPSQIFSLLNENIPGVYEYYKKLKEDYWKKREKRNGKDAISAEELRLNPIKLDYDKYDFNGVKVIDKYTYRINFTTTGVLF
ncbi:MAG: hypothetical protein K8S87_07800 [Planctomycetes bacterium]|nr:hypothetical protein [Planctomycetota bacterium]